jgi:hypothetical protein
MLNIEGRILEKHLIAIKIIYKIIVVESIIFFNANINLFV